MLSRTYKQVWVVDFEFKAEPGGRPIPVCLVAREMNSGAAPLRVWADEFTDSPPYSTDSDSLFVAYYAPAELGCHLALGWPLPANVLDLYCEFRRLTNGKVLPHGNGLLGALAYFGLDGIDSMEKESMRALIMRDGPYSASEKVSILDYCQSDVDATAALFGAIADGVRDESALDRALLRGSYAKAVSRMESAGVPIDVSLLSTLRDNWHGIRERLVSRIDVDFGVYEGATFKTGKFEALLQARGIAWPRTPTGRLRLDEDTFSEQCKTFPDLRPLKDLRNALGQLRLNALAVGSDGRNRAMLSMFRSKTGRNQPSNSRFVFGLSAWLRGLVRPRPGFALAYIDWSQQEFGIAAALSGDQAMMVAYSSGDPYLTFAKQAGAAPESATKESHADVREQFKAATLAVQYGMGEESLARRIKQPTPYARQLLDLHRRTYRRFWAWSDGVLDYALAARKLWTVFGWELHVAGAINERSLRNWPMQSNGSEMLRLACVIATEREIGVIAPVHDAILIEAPIEQLDADIARMQDAMREASAAVLDGFELRSDVKRICAPDRFEEPRGAAMWAAVNAVLAELKSEAGDATE